MSELLADFVDNLPCPEEKVAFDVVAIHCTMERQQCAARVMVSAGVGEQKEEPIGSCSCTQRWQTGTRKRDVSGMVWDVCQATDREETHIAPPIRQHLILQLVHPHPRYTTHYFHILKPV